MSFSNSDEKSAQPHPMLGAQLGQYKILDVIGGGGMGVVFRARQLTVDRDVALKLLPPALAHDEINTKRLEREAKALAKLSHPNIVTTFDFGLTEYAQAFLVMELVDGECLKEILLRETRIEVARALKIFVQLADAMRFAHSTGIIHRDLKPHNVMLARKPSPDFVKVLDFGIARLADSQKLTRVGEIIGSPLYMSPEQCLDDPVDARTDIYSLGILMYLCLTGAVPFKGNTLYETVEAKCTKPIPRFKDVAPNCEIPNFLEELIRHCIAVEPDERFQTMDEVKDLLESIQVSRRRSDTIESTAVLGHGSSDLDSSLLGSLKTHEPPSAPLTPPSALLTPLSAPLTRSSAPLAPSSAVSSSVEPAASNAVQGASPSVPGGASHPVPSSSTPSPKTMREKLLEVQKKSDSSASSQRISSASARGNSEDVNAAKHVRSRHMEAHRGIVLTPRVMVIGVVAVLAILFAGVIVGVSFVGKATSLSPQDDTAKHSSGTTGSADRSTVPINGDTNQLPNVVPVKPRLEFSRQKPMPLEAKSIPQSRSTSEAPTVLKAHANSAARSSSQAVPNSSLTTNHHSVSTLKKLKPPPRKRIDDSDSDLPRVRHTVPSDRGAEIWYDFDRRR